MKNEWAIRREQKLFLFYYGVLFPSFSARMSFAIRYGNIYMEIKLRAHIDSTFGLVFFKKKNGTENGL